MVITKNHLKKIFIFSLCLIFVLLLLELVLYFSCLFSAKKIPASDGQLLRIMLYGSSENPEGETVSAHISVLDLQGTEIAVIERSWPKAYLAVDFRKASFLGKSYFFPEVIYGTDSVSVRASVFERHTGSFLDRYYIENGKCLTGSTGFHKKMLYRFYKFSTGRSTVSLAACDTGCYYGVFAENGLLTVRSE